MSTSTKNPAKNPTVEAIARSATRDKVILAIAAPVLAIVAAIVISSLVFLASGENPFRAYGIMADYGHYSDSQVWIINKAVPYYPAAVGGAIALPGAIQIILLIVIAMLVGAIWSGIAGLLKTTRGVSEVITTIMLNAIAASIIGYFLQDGRLAIKDGNLLHTKFLPESSHFFSFPTHPKPVLGFVVIAVLAGALYWFGINRTRFGFDLRAVGASESAAEASGVSVKRMVVSSMLLSGAAAGLVGMPTLLGESFQYGTDFPAGIGFTGIAIALLGRNHPVGMAFGALLWAFLDRTGSRLEFEGYAQEIVGVIQGVIVLCVVIAYEIVRRYGLNLQQRKVGEELAALSRTTNADKSGKSDNPEVSA